MVNLQSCPWALYPGLWRPGCGSYGGQTVEVLDEVLVWLQALVGTLSVPHEADLGREHARRQAVEAGLRWPGCGSCRGQTGEVLGWSQALIGAPFAPREAVAVVTAEAVAVAVDGASCGLSWRAGKLESSWGLLRGSVLR